ncbi:MAG: NAD(P)-dependent dehydrogenase (short-subunit alcohol dehydrogenase family) [Enterobacterales bacterium]|jgi:NAD(P)-dependent dehydrogenase (short-subunit alcohol dehydrogenase family)
MKHLKMNILALFIVTFTLVGSSNSILLAEEAKVQKAVLVTGASTGIGRKIAELLASKGYFVYAGARKEKDLKELSALENMQAIRLDVTKQDEIDAAVATISKAGRGLHGLVNNAGVAILAPLIEVEEQDLEFLFDVNVYGVYRVTKAFAPLIIESKGRITTIGSISGILSGTLFGPYSMTKHAIEAYTDSLAREMQDFGVQVSVIEPGNYESKIGDSLMKRLKAKNSNFEKSLYKEQMEGFIKYFDGDREKGVEPDAVAEAALHAMFNDKPKRRYMVVPNEGQATVTVRKALQETLQLNQGHEYTYSRDELLKMMDEIQAELDK